MANSLATDTLKQLRIILSAVRQHFRALEDACGISGAQVWILSAIAETPGITVTKLGETLSVHVSTVSNMLDKLAKSGLVERVRSEGDRRVVNLRLTDAGQAILARAPQPLTGVVPHALENLPESVLKRLNADLGLVIQKMQHVDHGSADKPLSVLVR